MVTIAITPPQHPHAQHSTSHPAPSCSCHCHGCTMDTLWCPPKGPLEPIAPKKTPAPGWAPALSQPSVSTRVQAPFRHRLRAKTSARSGPRTQNSTSTSGGTAPLPFGTEKGYCMSRGGGSPPAPPAPSTQLQKGAARKATWKLMSRLPPLFKSTIMKSGCTVVTVPFIYIYIYISYLSYIYKL